MSLPLSVLKFGSSVLPVTRAAAEAVHEIYRELRAGRRVVAVVSAVGGATDRLLARARSVAEDPDEGALALYLSTGETASVAALTLALRQRGVSALALEGAELGLVTRGPRLDATPHTLDATRIRAALEQHSVVVVPGFLGRDEHGATTLLGRGGSDASAVFLAAELGAERCRLLKDVDGVFERDPAAHRAARRFASLSWNDALELNSAVVQPKAIDLARKRGLAIEVAALGSAGGTRIGAEPSRLVDTGGTRSRSNVVLVGCGTVGAGVFRELASRIEDFDVRRIAVRDVQRTRGASVPAARLTGDLDAALAEPCDLVVELTNDAEVALRVAEAALCAGRDLVTASKPLVADFGEHLERLARAAGAHVAFSAAVGGAVPMLEVARAASRRVPVISFEGVFNATTNFVTGEIASGASVDAAVAAARARGYAERDASRDLDGLDAADKVEILARQIWNRPVEWEAGARLDENAAAIVRGAARHGRVARFVASCRFDGYRAAARLELRELETSHPFASVRGASNALALRTRDGEIQHWIGEGAGRWPTTEAVLADILELERTRPSRALSEAS
jgi:homoserine dehydrogenase